MARVISDSCVSCGTCEGECPVGAISQGVLVYLQPASLAILVNTRYCADYLRHLVVGGSRGCRQRLVCAVL